MTTTLREIERSVSSSSGRTLVTSRRTIREALRTLRTDNMVVSRQRPGTTMMRRSVGAHYTYSITKIDGLL